MRKRLAEVRPSPCALSPLGEPLEFFYFLTYFIIIEPLASVIVKPSNDISSILKQLQIT